MSIARLAARLDATRRTIRYWVSRDLVDPPVCLGRDPRYPLRTVGQVDTLARLSIRRLGLAVVRFALFVEADSVPVQDALRIATMRIDAWKTSASAYKEQAALDPDLVRADIKQAARLRAGNSVLPREVRLSLEERETALAQAMGFLLGMQIEGAPDGMGAIERALGLRSGRSGATRETQLALTDKDLAAFGPEVMHEAVANATPVRARIARNVLELLCLWFPALIPSLLTTSNSTESKFLQVVQARADQHAPEAYVTTFAALLARQTPLPDEQLLPIERALQPPAVMLEMLTTQPPGALTGVLSRLRPLPRLKLEAAIALTGPP